MTGVITTGAVYCCAVVASHYFADPCLCKSGDKPAPPISLRLNVGFLFSDCVLTCRGIPSLYPIRKGDVVVRFATGDTNKRNCQKNCMTEQNNILPNTDKEKADQAFAKEGIPLVEQQQLALDQVRKLMSDHGVDPRFDEYVTATFSYILSALLKVATATDRDAASKEIADDLKQKWETWVANREKQEKEKEQAAAEKPANPEDDPQ